MKRRHPLDPPHTLFQEIGLSGVTIIVFAVVILTLAFPH